MQNIKQAALRIIERLPDQASWDEILYHIYAKQKVEMGLADVRAGRTVSHEEVKTEHAPMSDGKRPENPR